MNGSWTSPSSAPRWGSSFFTSSGPWKASAFSQGRPAIPRLGRCELNRRAFLEEPAGAIRDRLSFASHLLCRFAVQAGAVSAPDAKEFERRFEAALQDTS